MELILTYIGGLTAVVAALTLLFKGLLLLLKSVNKAIKQSSLVADSLGELFQYGFKRKKHGNCPLIDK